MLNSFFKVCACKCRLSLGYFLLEGWSQVKVMLTGSFPHVGLQFTPCVSLIRCFVQLCLTLSLLAFPLVDFTYIWSQLSLNYLHRRAFLSFSLHSLLPMEKRYILCFPIHQEQFSFHLLLGLHLSNPAVSCFTNYLHKLYKPYSIHCHRVIGRLELNIQAHDD